MATPRSQVRRRRAAFTAMLLLLEHGAGSVQELAVAAAPLSETELLQVGAGVRRVRRIQGLKLGGFGFDQTPWYAGKNEPAGGLAQDAANCDTSARRDAHACNLWDRFNYDALRPKPQAMKAANDRPLSLIPLLHAQSCRWVRSAHLQAGAATRYAGHPPTLTPQSSRRWWRGRRTCSV